MTDAIPSTDVIRLIVHRIPWPQDNHERPSLELKWKVTLDGETIVESSKRPFEDATAKLMRNGADGEKLVTMRHADLPHDSFVPHKLEIAAKPGLKRMEAGDQFRAYLAAKAESEEPETPSS